MIAMRELPDSCGFCQLDSAPSAQQLPEWYHDQTFSKFTFFLILFSFTFTIIYSVIEIIDIIIIIKYDHLACVDSVPMDAALEEPRTTVTAEKSKLLSKISHIAIFQKRSPVNTIMLPRAAVSTNLRI